MPGLRERNIAAAKYAIQSCALQLFTKQGYGVTTVEQIAAAAEVSPSTFFRYFKTKDAVLLYGSIDAIILEAFSKQPPSVPTIQAMRNAVQTLNGALSIEQKQLEIQRFKLLDTLPALRNAIFGEMAASIDLLAERIAQRVGEDATNIKVRNLAGALVGVMVTVLQQTYQNPSLAIFEGEMDAALASLEKGLTL